MYPDRFSELKKVNKSRNRESPVSGSHHPATSRLLPFLSGGALGNCRWTCSAKGSIDMAGSQVVSHIILIWILTRLATCCNNRSMRGFHNLLAALTETPRFLAMRLLHPTFRPRTRLHNFEWLKTILVGILVGHNLVLKVSKCCNTASPEFFKK